MTENSSRQDVLTFGWPAGKRQLQSTRAKQTPRPVSIGVDAGNSSGGYVFCWRRRRPRKSRLRMKRWIIIVLSILTVWVGVFAFLHWRQMPRPEEVKHKATPMWLSDSSRRILETSNHFVLLSLEPYSGQSGSDAAEKFHDFRVLGSVEIKDPVRKAELLRAFYKGIADSDGAVANCFNPRHGIRAVSGTNWIELVICFECYHMREFGTGSNDGATTTKTPGETFNRVLKEAGVPLTTN
jgi:hypothetical protein